MQDLLPRPETKADEYLYAIATELRALNQMISGLAAALQPPQPAPAGDTIALREPKRGNKPGAKLSE